MDNWVQARRQSGTSGSTFSATVNLNKVIAAEVSQIPDSIDYGIKLWLSDSDFRWLSTTFSNDSDARNALEKLVHGFTWS